MSTLNEREANSGSDGPQEMWTVYRQDDNGNRFVVEEHVSREEADRLVAAFEVRGHKQVYWAEPGPID
jgi:UDP-N-acetyl-2-amino-2-deoxyglucuronate dehydrogenase